MPNIMTFTNIWLPLVPEGPNSTDLLKQTSGYRWSFTQVGQNSTAFAFTVNSTWSQGNTQWKPIVGLLFQSSKANPHLLLKQPSDPFVPKPFLETNARSSEKSDTQARNIIRPAKLKFCASPAWVPQIVLLKSYYYFINFGNHSFLGLFKK